MKMSASHHLRSPKEDQDKDLGTGDIFEKWSQDEKEMMQMGENE